MKEYYKNEKERYISEGFVNYIAKPFNREQRKEKLNIVFEKNINSEDRLKDASEVVICDKMFDLK